jgi:hypothetical protein
VIDRTKFDYLFIWGLASIARSLVLMGFFYQAQQCKLKKQNDMVITPQQDGRIKPEDVIL